MCVGMSVFAQISVRKLQLCLIGVIVQTSSACWESAAYSAAE